MSVLTQVSCCAFTPGESISTVDGVSVGLYTGTALNLEGIEEMLPDNLCPLIKPVFRKSVFEFERGAVYVSPYAESSDIIGSLHRHYPGRPAVWKPSVGVFQTRNKFVIQQSKANDRDTGDKKI
ncbi:MAG: hypothetical protein A4E63_02694 [Syntrophorhabdus sp. PtaU1.Bin050]|nr:MAG: hypothetical protein A4E63_02694 [Syntrophorhabdus sp. PtaU1.Bin050]